MSIETANKRRNIRAELEPKISMHEPIPKFVPDVKSDDPLAKKSVFARKNSNSNEIAKNKQDLKTLINACF